VVHHQLHKASLLTALVDADIIFSVGPRSAADLHFIYITDIHSTS